MTEIWKTIPDYEGYEISSLGRVRSVDRFIKYKNGKICLHKGKLKIPQVNNAGYAQVSLYINKKAKICYIHRLVAFAFLPKPKDNQTQVDHIDCEKLNNNINNLRWVSPSENIKFRQINHPNAQARGENAGNAKLTNTEVRTIIERFNNGETISQVQRDYSFIGKVHMGRIYAGERWAHLDYLRKYDKDKYKKRHLKNNPDLIIKVKYLRGQGYNISEIGRKLNMSRALIRKILNNY